MASTSRQQVVEAVAAWEWDIGATARQYGLDPNVLAGLACQESAGQPFAVRAEPRYRWLFGDDPHEALNKPALSSDTTEWWCQKMSWGLCQIMGATAREMGFDGWLPGLCIPTVGLQYGAKYLAKQIKREDGDLRQGLLRYNGGGDPEYPAKVLAWAQAFKEYTNQKVR